MTKLDKPVRRESYTNVRQRGKTRPIVIEIHPTFVRLKLKGCYHWVTCTLDQLWTLGNRNAAESRRREREQARAAKKKEKQR
jgi:hypothetical protein